jgi:hypothetical protein
MPSPRKSKKHVGFSLDGFGEDDDAAGGKIEVFTDSKDKVPEVDETEDNPFYVKPGARPKAATRSHKRKRDADPHRNDDVKEALQRDEGVIYVL